MASFPGIFIASGEPNRSTSAQKSLPRGAGQVLRTLFDGLNLFRSVCHLAFPLGKAFPQGGAEFIQTPTRPGCFGEGVDFQSGREGVTSDGKGGVVHQSGNDQEMKPAIGIVFLPHECCYILIKNYL